MENPKTAAEPEFISSPDLLKRANVLYEFVDLFTDYETTPRNYGWTEDLTMNEVHLLAKIEACPGICSSDLVIASRRSKGLISRIIAKLEDCECIIRVPDKNDAKKQLLYVTAKGKQLCDAHARFDEQTLIKTYRYLRRDCTDEEIQTFYKVLQVYNNIMNAAERKRRRLALEQAKEKNIKTGG